MKIGNNPDRIELSQTTSSKTGSAKTAGKADSAVASAKADSSTKISLSDLSSLETKVAGDSGFDAGRVEQIKDAIRSGDFKVNADVVADKLIASVREMLVKTQH